MYHCSIVPCVALSTVCTPIFMIDGHALIGSIYAMNCQDKTMSVWLQALGEFFWVFLLTEANDLEIFKIMGETTQLDGKAVDLVHASRSQTDVIDRKVHQFAMCQVKLK